MVADHKRVLERIASLVTQPTSGPGFDRRQFVPACTINNRTIADMLERRLIEAAIQARRRRDRLSTQFFVPAEDLGKTLKIRDRLLEDQPDTVARKFSRDFDSIFFLLPFTVLAAFLDFVLAGALSYTWIAILVSGSSVMVVWERVNRQYRYQLGAQWGVGDLLCLIAIAAVNFATWKAVL